MRVLRLLVAALLGISVVVGIRLADSADHREATGQQPLLAAPTTTHLHPDLGFVEEAAPGEPVVTMLRTTVRTVVAVLVTPTAGRVEAQVARGPPNGR
ncbi:hypothetical protein FHS29_000233 [Saccharothrix tamanrassetensis]|uniref:Uncharacterized protein n=1 Tax=Saccharothrix tamanrassetensis TaxID=1051531 RepID=A0A841C9P6_9PSEU|nr:hypothetical protein [Saccharothrix tamanrassetensis]MBB5953663.1 hypothetical protein [Saccharothrix tamanrassetensis]